MTALLAAAPLYARAEDGAPPMPEPAAPAAVSASAGEMMAPVDMGAAAPVGPVDDQSISGEERLPPNPGPPSPPPGVNVLPAMSLSTDQMATINPDAPTHPDIKLTPDKSEIVRLDKDAATVVIGSPAHLSVLVENTRTLVLVPKAPGATYFTVLDGGGNVVMQRHALVAAPAEKYVRIRRSCANDDKSSCETTQVYYCPDMCHQIMMDASVKTGGSKSAPLTAGGKVDAALNALKAEKSTNNESSGNTSSNTSSGGDTSSDAGR